MKTATAVSIENEAADERAQHVIAPSEQYSLWTAKQAAAYLQIHERTLIRKATAGEIPGFQIGRCWRFVPEELHRWAREQSSNAVKLSPVPQTKGENNAGRTPKRMA